MTERQIHGFNFEHRIKDILNIYEEKPYTSKWDIGSNISIKFISTTGTVDMGSVIHIFESFETPNWSMILGRHSNKVCTDVYELQFTKDICDKLKGSLTLKDVKEFDRAIKTFSKGHHEEARQFAKQWKIDNKAKTGLLTIQPKIDSKTQRRVQCGINQTNLRKLFSLETTNRFSSLIGENFA